MSQYTLLVDHTLCFDCKACEVACKQENNLPPGPRWIQVMTSGPRKAGDKLITDFIPVTCRHCANPPCVTVCPTDAISKRPDGIVIIDSILCNGCMACIPACPWIVPQFNPQTNIVEKCNLCLNRLEEGLKPACVQACPSNAIYFGDIVRVTAEMKKQRISRNH